MEHFALASRMTSTGLLALTSRRVVFLLTGQGEGGDLRWEARRDAVVEVRARRSPLGTVGTRLRIRAAGDDKLRLTWIAPSRKLPELVEALKPGSG